MTIDNLTIGEAKQLAALFKSQSATAPVNPFLGKRVIVRTYSAGVHIGTLVKADGMECQLADSLRRWKWGGGGLSLSAVANNGIKGGRLDKTGNVYLTNAIEYIPTTDEAEKTYVNFIEN